MLYLLPQINSSKENSLPEELAFADPEEAELTLSWSAFHS
jgi:hypothetical protein